MASHAHAVEGSIECKAIVALAGTREYGGVRSTGLAGGGTSETGQAVLAALCALVVRSKVETAVASAHSCIEERVRVDARKTVVVALSVAGRAGGVARDTVAVSVEGVSSSTLTVRSI